MDPLQRLIDGNRRYVDGRLQHPNQTPARREEVARGQKPFAAVVACADSRVAPEVVLTRDWVIYSCFESPVTWRMT